MKVRPVSVEHAVYRDMTDQQWYWTIQSFSRPVGPFPSREAARADFRYAMGTAGMYEKSLQRPSNYAELSPERQWEIDKELGILDWDGSDDRPRKPERKSL